MASNEMRARLVGRKVTVQEGRDPQHGCTLRLSDCPDYESERERRSACAELLEYVKAKPPSVIETFIEALHAPAITPFRGRNALAYMTATPAQICAAFDATFAKELAELEKTNAK